MRAGLGSVLATDTVLLIRSTDLPTGMMIWGVASTMVHTSPSSQVGQRGASQSMLLLHGWVKLTEQCEPTRQISSAVQVGQKGGRHWLVVVHGWSAVPEQCC